MANKKIGLPLALLTLTFYFSCAHPKHQINPEAKKLNDSAMYMVVHTMPDTVTYKKAITLINRAIKLDSNYFRAYVNKFGFQTQVAQFDSALVTGKRIIKLRPDAYPIWQMMGSIYEVKGDTVSAKDYYNKALITCDKIIDTMRSENMAYKITQTDKARYLILLRKEKEGRDIFKNLNAKEPEGPFKDVLKEYLSMPRQDFIDFGQPKDVAIEANKNH